MSKKIIATTFMILFLVSFGTSTFASDIELKEKELIETPVDEIEEMPLVPIKAMSISWWWR